MEWLNEPKTWSKTNNGLSMFVTPKTDFWRVTHYGFTVDDGPFYYSRRSGEFEATVKIQGQFKQRYDQMGLMIRKDENNWIKTGIEYVEGKFLLSAVVTRDKSDWSMVDLKSKPEALWIKLKRQTDTVEISYSLDGNNYETFRLAFFPDNCEVKIGLTAASPDGEGFDASFENFEINHLPDKRRLEWLKANSST